MLRLWRQMGEAFGLNQWAEARGPVDGDQFREWCAGLADYSDQQVCRGLRNVLEFADDRIPTLSEFAELCLVERISRQDQDPPRQRTLRVTADIARREIERQQRVARSPGGRDPHKRDVEPFEKSYHNCGLGRRWPGGEIAR